jgi:hypothetical protein
MGCRIPDSITALQSVASSGSSLQIREQASWKQVRPADSSTTRYVAAAFCRVSSRMDHALFRVAPRSQCLASARSQLVRASPILIAETAAPPSVRNVDCAALRWLRPRRKVCMKPRRSSANQSSMRSAAHRRISLRQSSGSSRHLLHDTDQQYSPVNNTLRGMVQIKALLGGYLFSFFIFSTQLCMHALRPTAPLSARRRAFNFRHQHRTGGVWDNWEPPPWQRRSMPSAHSPPRREQGGPP